VPEELALGTRLLRTRQTIDIAVHGRQIPVLIEPGFDELQAGDLDRAPIQVYRPWKHLHTPDSRFPHGESPADARRRANALRRLLARTETVTLVVIHEFALRHIAMAAAAGGLRLPDMAVANAVPYLFDDRAAQRAVANLDAMARSGQPR
jgi:broad specificity phosphatase PhoE